MKIVHRMRAIPSYVRAGIRKCARIRALSRQLHVRQCPAVDVPHGSPVEGPAGVPRQVDHRLPAVRPLVRERRDRAPVHGIAGGADHRGGDPGARHGLHEREGPPARGRGAEKGGSRSVGVSRGGRNTKVHVVSDVFSQVGVSCFVTNFFRFSA